MISKFFVWLLCLTICDIATGYAKGLKTHSWKSALSIEGIFTKLTMVFLVVVAGFANELLPVIGIQTELDIAVITEVVLCVNESMSILENVNELGGGRVPILNKMFGDAKAILNDKTGVNNFED